MSRHVSLDQLARLDARDLRPRKAARVSDHLAACTRCAEVSGRLSGVSALLSGVAYPAMPASVSVRIDNALAAEAAQRVAAEAPTEAGRRDLPARSARSRLRYAWAGPGQDGRGRPAWRLPAQATRVLATAGAIIVVGAGGYEIAVHAGGAPATVSAGSGTHAGAAQHGSPVSVGPQVTYGQDGSAETIATVSSDTDFRAATLAGQAAAAVVEAQVDGVHATPAPAAAAGLRVPSASSAGGNKAFGAASGAAGSQLAGCIGRVVPAGQVVLLVEHARFEGARATIIVSVPASARAASPPKDAEIWAVGARCSASNSDVLDHVRVARL